MTDETCAKKRKFLYKDQAKNRARILSRQGSKVYVYECPTCRAFHLTHMPQDLVRKRNRTDDR